jgi:hypothetical protein
MSGYSTYEQAVHSFMNPPRRTPGAVLPGSTSERRFDTSDQVCWRSADPQFGNRHKRGRVVHWGYIPFEAGGGDWCYIVAVGENKLFKRQVQYAVLWQADLLNTQIHQPSKRPARYLRRVK